MPEEIRYRESAVFERPATIESWDRDYYHPIAERYYDRAIPEMLRLMEVEPGARVLDAGVRARRTQRACRPGGLPRLRRRHLADHAAGSARTDRHRWTSFRHRIPPGGPHPAQLPGPLFPLR